MWHLLYILMLPIIGAYYGKAFMGYVFFFSFFLAMVPFTSKKLLFGAPLLLLIWHLTFGNLQLALWALFFVPLWYISTLRVVIGGIKSIWHNED